MYQFTVCQQSSSGTSKIMNSSLESARFRGALSQVFGDPPEVKTIVGDGQSPFEYVIETSSPSGHRVILTAYDGPSGPAIGGNHQDPESRVAAQELEALLTTTTPRDYEIRYYNEEYDVTITCRCQSGACSSDEVEGNQL